MSPTRAGWRSRACGRSCSCLRRRPCSRPCRRCASWAGCLGAARAIAPCRSSSSRPMARASGSAATRPSRTRPRSRRSLGSSCGPPVGPRISRARCAARPTSRKRPRVGPARRACSCCRGGCWSTRSSPSSIRSISLRAPRRRSCARAIRRPCSPGVTRSGLRWPPPTPAPPRIRRSPSAWSSSPDSRRSSPAWTS